MQKSVSLTLVITACLWYTMQGLLPVFPQDGDEAFDGAATLYNSDPVHHIESLSRVIDQQADHPQSAERLAETYGLRGSFRLQQHDAAEALADFDAALRLNPGELAARYGRAECYRQLGDCDWADAEFAQAGTLDLSDAFPGLKPFVTWWGGVNVIVSTPAGAWLLVAAAWALLTSINAAVGWGQTSAASGSVGRLAYVAAGLGLLEVLPLGVWATLLACQSAAAFQGWLAAGVTLLSLAATIPMMQPPIRLRGTRETLPRVDDKAFLERVAELAQQMNVPVPLARLWPSITGSQQAQALVGCLPAPQLVVTDGILHRLSAVERDAVVAHELGHVANGSLWLLTAVIPVTCAVATAVSAWFPLSIAVPFGLALGIGLRRIVSRPLELDSDRRAAHVIGFRETAAALTKIHAVNSLGNRGLLPLLVYATATHPSREVRLWALRSAAPGGELTEMALYATTIRRHRIAAAAAFVIWLMVLTGTLAAAHFAPAFPLLAAPLWGVILTPPVLLLLAQWRQVAAAERRLGCTWTRKALVAVALVACPVLAYYPEVVELMAAPLAWLEDSTYFILYPLFLAGVWYLGGLWFKRLEETRKLRGEVAVAFQVHDFPRVLEIARAAPVVVGRDPLLRYNLAFARAICGDREGAIADFEKLWKDKPGIPITAITLSVLLLDADRPERALDVARRVAQRLPDDAEPHLLVARSLRRLERLDESQETCDRALALEPGGGKAHAIAAALALDEGDFFRAQQLIEAALELAPGDPYILLVRAEIVLKTQPFENPRPAVEEALAGVRTNSFAFYRADVERLEQMLAECERARHVNESPRLQPLAESAQVSQT